MDQGNLKFCTSLDDVYEAMFDYLVDASNRYAHELFLAFTEDYTQSTDYIKDFLQGKETAHTSNDQKKKTLAFLASLDKKQNKKIVDEFLSTLILRKNSGLSREDIYANIEQIQKSKEFHKRFFEKVTRKSQEDFSDEHREVTFDSSPLINALRADITVMSPDIKLRKEIAEKNGYSHVGKRDPKHNVARCFAGRNQGVVDKTGKEIVPLDESYTYFVDDYIVKKYGRGKKFYDYSGKLVHDLTDFYRVTDPSEGLIGARDRGNGEHGTQYIDQVTGKKVFELDKDINHIGQFKDGLAKVRRKDGSKGEGKGKHGYINKKGEIVIPCEYSCGSQNENGYMLADMRKNEGKGDGDGERDMRHRLFILHYDGSNYTKKEIHMDGVIVCYLDDGSRDRPGFVDGKFSMWDRQYHKWMSLDTEGKRTESREKVIDLESGLKIVERYNRESRDSQNHFFECDIFDKEGKEILSKKKYSGIDSANKLILLDDGIMTFGGEYIGPLKSYSLDGFVKRDED